MRQKLAQSSRFESGERTKGAINSFGINHYAGLVYYAVDDFLSKNKDFVVAEHLHIFQTSSNSIFQLLFPAQAQESGAAQKSSYQFHSIGLRFKSQLGDLMEALKKTEPHYIRCIKPNPESKSESGVDARSVIEISSIPIHYEDSSDVEIVFKVD